MEFQVPDVPYRCPRCGGARTFNTLSELKTHVAEEHAYSAQKRQRLRIFDYNPNHAFKGTGRHSPLLQSMLDEGDKLEEELKAAKREELNNKTKRQKQQSSRPPASSTTLPSASTHSPASPKKGKGHFHRPMPSQEPDHYLQKTVSQLNQDVLVQRHQQFRTADALYTTQDVLSGVEEAAEGRVSEQKNFIADLSRQLVEKEQQLLELRTELEKVKDKDRAHKGIPLKQRTSADTTDSANNIGRRERQLIEDELVRKKTELEKLNKQLASAKQTDNRKKLQGPSGRRHEASPEKNRDRADQDRTKRGSNGSHSADVSSPNSDVSEDSWTRPSVNGSRTSSSSIKDRSNIAKQLRHNRLSKSPRIPNLIHKPHPPLPESHHHIHNKLRQDDVRETPNHDDSSRSQKLKEERSLLVHQMKELLSKATTDNEKLKDELMAKENQLIFLNQELERTKTDQRDLMDETYDLYREAEKSVGELKERLKQKETQLEHANGRLEEIRTAQERLVGEKENVARNADDKDMLYQNMMRDREEQIQTLNGLLLSQQEEREKLREMAGELKREVQEKEKAQQELRQAIANKEQELAKAREDVETLTTFLQTAAARESVARCKLETFVSELIDRADKAEKELQVLRGIESSSSGNFTSDPSLAGAVLSATGLAEVSPIPGQSLVNQAAGPFHSTPVAAQSGRHGKDPKAKQIPQTSLEPWYNNLGLANLPGTTEPPSSAFPQGAGNSFMDTGAPHSLQQVSGLQSQPPPSLPDVGYISLPGQHLQMPAQQFQQQYLPQQLQTQQYPPHHSQQQPSAQYVQQQFSSQPVHQQSPNPSRRHQNHPQSRVAVNGSMPPVYNNMSPFNDDSAYNDPNLDVYTIPQAQPLPLSKSSGDFASQQVRHPTQQGRRGDVHPAAQYHASPSPYLDSVGDDSSKYATLPRKKSGVGRANGHSGHPPVSMQSPTYDGGDEQLYSDSLDGMLLEDFTEKKHNFVVNGSGKVLQNGVGSKPVHSSPLARKINNSQAPVPEERSGRNVRDTVDALNGEGRKQQNSTSPHRTYPIYSVTGEDAREVRSDDFSDSPYSHQDTPHFNKAVIDRKPKLKGKVRPAGAQMNGKLYRYVDDDSTDGVDLSVDENGIMWEAVDSFSGNSESYRMSPYGSETAGDVDTSVLMSSRSPGNKRVPRGGQDTDEDIDSLDDDGILRPTKDRGSLHCQKGSHGRRAPQLGDRMDRVLKSVGEDDLDTESMELLMKQPKGHGMRNNNIASRNATSVYGTSRRVPRPEVAESPMERALAVQNRVKSLTFPRTEKKSVTISDTSSSEFVPRRPAVNSVGSGPKPAARQRKVMNADRPHPTPALEEEGPEPLEGFSSSSYASMPPPHPLAKGVLGATAVQKIQTDEAASKPAGAERNISPQNWMKNESAPLSNVSNKAPEKEAVASDSQPQVRAKQEQRGSDHFTNAVDDERRLNKSEDSHRNADRNGFNLEETQNDNQGKDTDLRGQDLSQSSLNTTPHTQHNNATENSQPETATSTIKRQPSSNTPLTRQASISTDESDMKKFAEAPLKPASQLRARFAQSCSESSMLSSEGESVSMSVPRPSTSLQLAKEDSTDFDLESDLEKYTGLGGGDGGRRGSLAGKSGIRKTVLKKTKGKKAGGKQKVPNAVEDSGSNASDIEAAKKNKKREDARRRRVALFRVFLYLDTRNLCKMALVCKEWQRVSRHPSLWKNVHLKYERVSSQFLVTLSTWCTQMTSLTLEGLRSGSRRPSETMDEYNRRIRACLEPGLEELLKTSQDSLKSVSIIACGNVLTDKCMWLVSGYCRLLQKLTYLSDTHPLTAEVMWALGGGCPSITSLIIPPLFPCHNSEGMNNRCLMLIAQFYPDLLEVGVGGRSLDITGLVPLVQSCQRLHALSLDHIKEMGDDSSIALCRAGLKQLTQLEICGTSITANALKTYYDSCRHLKEIRVFVCINDYFEDIRKKKNKEEYKKIVSSLEELKSQVGLGNILQVRAAPAD
ncbi:uncharacterized protein [Littorina saxatilis]|uniref:F-box domain-containing protein n=1 Tax=Littorina saxatilis TaxID=31220 RepID=A0AAN9GJG1_9CAEN